MGCASARNLRGNLHVKSKDLNGPEIYLRFYFPKIFLAKQHLKEDFPQRFLAVGYPKKIHGPHGEHGKRFSLKIILKIFVKISSISDAIQNKTLPRSEELERIFS